MIWSDSQTFTLLMCSFLLQKRYFENSAFLSSYTDASRTTLGNEQGFCCKVGVRLECRHWGKTKCRHSILTGKIFFFFFIYPSTTCEHAEKMLFEDWNMSLSPFFGHFLKLAGRVNSVWLPMQGKFLHGWVLMLKTLYHQILPVVS